MKRITGYADLKRFQIMPEVKRHIHWQPYIGILLPALIVWGWFFPAVGYVLVGCMFAAVGFGVVKGRYWCDWMCPRGSFWDSYLRRVSFNRTVPRFLRSLGWRLFWVTLLMLVITLMVIRNWGDWYRIGMVPFLAMLIVTTVVGLVFGILYHSRAWCMFCPVGSMANFMGRGKHLLSVAPQCLGINCRQCYKVCRMQIHPGASKESGKVANGDCLKCSRCIEVCPKGALSWSKEEFEEKKKDLVQIIAKNDCIGG
jgi:polyferredoxin